MRIIKIAAALVALVASAAALTQGPALQNPAAKVSDLSTNPLPAERAQLTRADADAWLDGYMPYALARGDIAGAVVVVVKDGQVLTQRGFGYSDVAARKPVDPATTMFRPGSTAKLFTWTAVMQLVEQGKIDLDADVNQYLDFKIPPRDGKPITMRNIMTHTPGFEETARGLLRFGGKLPSLGDSLKDWIPERVFAPGTTPAYSNYATALAGYIVERLSGMPYEVYIERNIFQRLGMTHSTFRQPLPGRFAPFMSRGYELGSGDAQPYELGPLSPAGAAAVSGTDMAKFMIAYLNQGGALIKPETTRLMHTLSPVMIPGLNRMALGFWQQQINGQMALTHGGDTMFFHSLMWILPQENVGVFVSMNSAGKDGASGAIREALFEQFADRYFPASDDRPPVEQATAEEHAKMLTGNWNVSRRSFSNFLAAPNLFGQTRIGLDKDGRPLIEDVANLGGAPRKWIEIAPFLWQDAYGHQRLGAKVENGKIVRWSFNDVSPVMVWDRVPWYFDSAWLLPLFLFGLAIVAITALSWPVGAIARRRYGATLALAGTDLKLFRLVRGFAWLVVLALAGWMMLLAALGDFANHFKYDWAIWLLQIVGTIGFLGLLGVAAWNLWRVWKGDRGWFAKLWSVLLVLAAFLILWVAFGAKLISFGTNF